MVVGILLTFSPPSLSSDDVGPLLSTKWGQYNEYAKYAPYNRRVGCWSTAFGQILYHHRLAPLAGRVRYDCTEMNVTISEDLSSYQFDMDKLSKSLDQVARYLYAVSVIIQKDYGTYSYRLSHLQRAQIVEKYFYCTTELHTDLLPERLNTLVRSEIGNGRPVLIHLRNKAKILYHAAVIDGYKKEGNTFRFHINMGRGGDDDDWFDLSDTIQGYDDISYHRIVTIKPNRRQPKE